MNQTLFGLLLLFTAMPVLYSQAGSAGNGSGGGIPAGDAAEEAAAFLPGTEPVWRQALGGAVTGLPAVQAESVVAVCDGGALKCYSRTGRQLWTYYARGKLAPYVTRSREGTSYICGTNGSLLAINRAGRELWQINLGSPISAPVISGWDGRIFVATRERLFCFTAAGFRLWSLEPESPFALEPVPNLRGGLAAVLENGDLLDIDPFGEYRSQKLSPAPALITPMEDGSVLGFYTAGAPELIGPDGTAGRKLPALPGLPLAAASRGDKAAAVFADGRVQLLSCTEGRVLWTGESHIAAAEETGMIYDERGIYVLSRSGAAGFAGDGRRLWLFRLRGSAAVPAFSDEGLLYSGGSDWILYAYKVEERIREQPRSLYGPAPLGSYGMGNPFPSPWADYYYRFDESRLRLQLARIAGDITQGRTGRRERAYAAYLMEIARGLSEGALPASAPPPLREQIEALRLLGFLGSRETIPFLADLFYRAREPLIKAAAAEAIGRIGVDPDGLAIRVFTWAALPPEEDEQVLAAVARATGALCRFSGPPLSGAGVRLLSVLAADSRPPPVRREARREIDSLAP
ncbi:MAG: PQQ-binding-like beta-propeller repeat protein [Treponema sp.]|jgi:outer membrane protein assembly factor BamB|nr:PQQ-binding-like beta-propeller repeat protein [Treponema sp.]